MIDNLLRLTVHFSQDVFSFIGEDTIQTYANSYVKNVDILDNVLINTPWNGVYADGGVDVTVEDCEFSNNINLQTGVTATKTTTITLDKVTFQDNVGTAEPNVSALAFASSDANLVIQETYFLGNTGYTAQIFAIFRSSISMERCCIIGGASDAALFASQDSTFGGIVEATNFIDELSTNVCNTTGSNRLFYEDQGGKCYQGSPDCSGTCRGVASSPICLLDNSTTVAPSEAPSTTAAPGVPTEAPIVPPISVAPVVSPASVAPQAPTESPAPGVPSTPAPISVAPGVPSSQAPGFSPTPVSVSPQATTAPGLPPTQAPIVPTEPTSVAPGLTPTQAPIVPTEPTPIAPGLTPTQAPIVPTQAPVIPSVPTGQPSKSSLPPSAPSPELDPTCAPVTPVASPSYVGGKKGGKKEGKKGGKKDGKKGGKKEGKGEGKGGGNGEGKGGEGKGGKGKGTYNENESNGDDDAYQTKKGTLRFDHVRTTGDHQKLKETIASLNGFRPVH